MGMNRPLKEYRGRVLGNLGGGPVSAIKMYMYLDPPDQKKGIAHIWFLRENATQVEHAKRGNDFHLPEDRLDEYADPLWVYDYTRALFPPIEFWPK